MYNNLLMMQTQYQEVDGYRGASALPMGPNSSMLALDKTQSILWVIRTDQNCVKTDILPFDLSPHVPEPDPAIKNLDERMTGIENQMSTFAESLKRIEELIK